jgi:small subunit ribosomal protein S10
MKVKIFILVKSFDPNIFKQLFDTFNNQNYIKNVQVLGSEGKQLPYRARSNITSIALPLQQSKYTVLRSPHIDKKSREQFEKKIYKHLFIISSDLKNIREKLINLKFHEVIGIQMKVTFHTKTRLNWTSSEN